MIGVNYMAIPAIRAANLPIIPAFELCVCTILKSLARNIFVNCLIAPEV